MSILSDKDQRFINDNKALFDRSTDIVQKFRTPTEMQVSVLNDFDNPTADAKYWQLQREVTAHYQEIIKSEFEARRKMLELKKLKYELKEIKTKIENKSINLELGEIEYQQKQIDIEETEWGLSNLKKITAARVEELRNWKAIQEDLKPNLEFSDSNPDEHQLISYTRRFIMQAMALPQSKASAAEAKNILAHLYTAMKYVKKYGLMNKVVEPFNRNPRVLQIINEVAGLDKPKLKVANRSNK